MNANYMAFQDQKVNRIYVQQSQPIVSKTYVCSPNQVTNPVAKQYS